MLHDIFYKKSKKTSKQKTPKIIADIHEKNSPILSDLYSSNQVRLEIKSLKIADYLIGKTAIERKTISDFVSSMLNKRLTTQLKQMKKYESSLLILEGPLEGLLNNKNKINPNAVRGFILSIINNHKIPIIFTKNPEDTSKYLIVLAKQTIKHSCEPTLHSRIPKNINEQKQYILESFPNIGPQKAKSLLKKFKTLEAVFGASKKDLQEILKNKSKDFRNLINS